MGLNFHGSSKNYIKVWQSLMVNDIKPPQKLEEDFPKIIRKF